MDIVPVGKQSLSIGALANAYASQNVLSDYHAQIAENTRRRQEADLRLFATYLEAAGMQTGNLMHDPSAWSGITHGLVKGFVKWQLQQGYAIGSVNVRLATVKAYSKLVQEAGVISPEDYVSIRFVSGYRHKQGRNIDADREQTRRPDAKKAQPISISKEDATRLKTEQPDTPQGRRDAFLMHLLLDHGLRCGEAAALMPDSVSLSEGTLRFYRQKVDKEQTHSLTKDSLLSAIRYFEVCSPAEKLLMGSKKGGALQGEMSERAITDRVKTLGKAIGIEGLSAHDCRHYWATAALKAGTDLKSLQDAGGWNSPAMPLRYAESAKIANEGVKL